MFKNLKYVLWLLLLIPITCKAYSDYIYASGENVGIKINTNYIMIVGTYDIEGISPAIDANLQIGDKIFEVNDTEVHSISDLEQIISNNRDTSIKIGYIRNNQKYETDLNLVNNKTGMYIKDTIAGIGTLTFIDPNTLIFGALGHEINETNSNNIVNMKDGLIFESNIVGIEPSKMDSPGEKRATLSVNNIYGNIYKNTKKGIFGKYTLDVDNNKLYKVATINDIKIGPAKILTVLDDNVVKEYSINILKVSTTNSKIKNLIFEVTDPILLEKTGGIIQGMSGSPIIQGEYIVGAVTHVVVNDPKKGYGILIENMLEEAEKSE